MANGLLSVYVLASATGGIFAFLLAVILIWGFLVLINAVPLAPYRTFAFVWLGIGGVSLFLWLIFWGSTLLSASSGNSDEYRLGFR